MMVTGHFKCIVRFLRSLGFVSLLLPSRWLSQFSSGGSYSLHLNSWGFIQAFEIFCYAYNLLCNVRMFLHFFLMGMTTKRSEREVDHCGWTTFSSHRHIGVFTAFKDSFKGFEDDFVRIQVPVCFPAFFLGDDGAPFPSFYNPTADSSSPNESTTVQFLSE